MGPSLVELTRLKWTARLSVGWPWYIVQHSLKSISEWRWIQYSIVRITSVMWLLRWATWVYIFRDKTNVCFVLDGFVENVHFQHSAQLMKALTEAGVNFQSQIYADLTHDQLITGSKTSRHLYRTLGRFLKHDCWFSAKSLEAKLLHVASETNKKQNMKS